MLELFRKASVLHPWRHFRVQPCAWRGSIGFAAAVKDKNQDLIKAFEKCACKVPVRFELLPNQDEVTVRKLQFDQDIKSKAEMQGLYGYKMAKIYAQVQQELTGKNLPSQYADVHRYLLRVAWTAADLPKLSSVATHLKVHSRLTEDSVEALDILESHYGKHHALANISSLDVVAGKTSAKEQGLQQRPGLGETCSFSGLSLFFLALQSHWDKNFSDGDGKRECGLSFLGRMWNWIIDGVLVKHLRGEMTGQASGKLTVVFPKANPLTQDASREGGSPLSSCRCRKARRC